MSKTHVEKVPCTQCGKEMDVVVWNSMNEEINPDAAKAVQEGSFFKIECPHCKTKNTVIYPMLYHRMSQQVMIYLVPGDPKNVITTIKGMPMPGYKYRIVTDENGLREKLFI